MANWLVKVRIKQLPVSAKELEAQSLTDPTLMRVRACNNNNNIYLIYIAPFSTASKGQSKYKQV